ncbi:MAG: hypothetical protein AAGC60_04645 [Acidobacteriota bacterium]
MSCPDRFRRATWLRALAAVLALSLVAVGFAPTLHHHEVDEASDAACHELGHQATVHFEAVSLEHHEPCAICAKTVSFAPLDLPSAPLVGLVIAERGSVDTQLLPAGIPGRHGASRAPPRA